MDHRSGPRLETLHTVKHEWPTHDLRTIPRSAWNDWAMAKVFTVPINSSVAAWMSALKFLNTSRSALLRLVERIVFQIIGMIWYLEKRVNWGLSC